MFIKKIANHSALDFNALTYVKSNPLKCLKLNF